MASFIVVVVPTAGARRYYGPFPDHQEAESYAKPLRGNGEHAIVQSLWPQMDFEQELEQKFTATLSSPLQKEQWTSLWGIRLASSEIEMLWDWLVMGCELARAQPERELT